MLGLTYLQVTGALLTLTLTLIVTLTLALTCLQVTRAAGKHERALCLKVAYL